MLRSDNFSLLQVTIVTIAEPSLPLLISSHKGLQRGGVGLRAFSSEYGCCTY